MKLLAVEERVCADPMWNGLLLGYPMLDRACLLLRRGCYSSAGLPGPELIKAALSPLSPRWQDTGQEHWE